MRDSNCWLATGAAMAGLAVIAGAFGAHGLDTYFVEKYEGETRVVAGQEIPASRKYLGDYKTGVRYHMWHALGLIAVGLLSAVRPTKLLRLAGWLFLAGILLFSGSLYVLTISGQTFWGMIAPIGGMLMIFGWGVLAFAACRCGPQMQTEESPAVDA